MTIPETYCRTGSYKVDHSTFGGVILSSDYDTMHSGSRNMATRIVAAQKFDNWCRNNKGNNYNLPKGRKKKND